MSFDQIGSTLYIRFFFFNDTATTEIYTLSLHDALPISYRQGARRAAQGAGGRRKGGAPRVRLARQRARADRKSTRLNSSHGYISYAVFCLKKKNTDVHATTCTEVHRDQLLHSAYQRKIY